MTDILDVRRKFLEISRELVELLVRDGPERPGLRRARDKLELLAKYLQEFDESNLRQWEERGILAQRLGDLTAQLHAAALRGPVVAAASIEGVIEIVMTRLGADRWKAEKGVRELALPAPHTAVICELARAQRPLSLAEICSSGNQYYAEFYDANRLRRLYKELTATGFLGHQVERRKGTPWVWWLTPEGRKAVEDGELGPNFPSFSNAFDGLAQQQRQRYFELWGKFIGNGGVMPPVAPGIAPAVRAYAILGIAEPMLEGGWGSGEVSATRAAVMVAIRNLGGGARVPVHVMDIRAAAALYHPELTSVIESSKILASKQTPYINFQLGVSVEHATSDFENYLTLTPVGADLVEQLVSNPGNPDLKSKVAGLVLNLARAEPEAEELHEIMGNLRENFPRRSEQT